MSDNKKTAPFKLAPGRVESDNFVLPIAPPQIPLKPHQPSVFHGNVEEGAVQADAGRVAVTNKTTAKLACEEIGITKTAGFANILNRNDPSSPNKVDNNTSSVELVTSIDDSLIVAFVNIFLSIGATIFFVWMAANASPVFLIPLLVIYAIEIDFFKKRKIRAELRRKHSDQSNRFP